MNRTPIEKLRDAQGDLYDAKQEIHTSIDGRPAGVSELAIEANEREQGIDFITQNNGEGSLHFTVANRLEAQFIVDNLIRIFGLTSTLVPTVICEPAAVPPADGETVRAVRALINAIKAHDNPGDQGLSGDADEVRAVEALLGPEEHDDDIPF